MELSQYEDKLYSEIKKLIDSSRSKVAATVNSEITDLYWKDGRHAWNDVRKRFGNIFNNV